MPTQNINVIFTVTWVRPNGINGPYCFGDRKEVRVDPNWAKRNVIYRWIKASTGEVTMVGETDRSLAERANILLGDAGIFGWWHEPKVVSRTDTITAAA